MNSLFIPDPADNPFLTIAHRGASYYAPENTMAAFELAYQMEADMIEFDVQLSKDGIPVVFHDFDIKKRTNGTGFIGSLTFDELQKLDAGKWFSLKFSGTKIPTLEEILRWSANKILVNIEIKTESVSDKIQGGIEEKVLELVHGLDMQKKVLISSFDYRALERIRNLSPEIKTGLLYYRKISKGKTPLELLQQYGANFFNCTQRQINKKEIKLLQQNGFGVLIYTVNRKQSMHRLMEAGVNGIFTDKPDLLKKIADENNNLTAL